ncbi:MAG: hypothetical protein KAT46_05490 [Deltaproteobacteria bacterium]|nr:hypothetical protein [Deltaproteobacteria bacterium]
MWLTLFLSVLLVLTGARSIANASDNKHPQWVYELIEKLGSSPVANPPAKVIQSIYNNSTVYLLPPRCCDIQSVLYSEEGEIICNPSGGLSGRGDGRCTDFIFKKDSTIIWEDLRTN